MRATRRVDNLLHRTLAMRSTHQDVPWTGNPT
jgi:hypothetical protein